MHNFGTYKSKPFRHTKISIKIKVLMVFPTKVFTNTNNYNLPVQISPYMKSALKSMEFNMCQGLSLA